MKSSNFSSNSRYANIETTQLKGVDGRIVVYLRRRIVPAPELFALLQEHLVSEGDRLDNIAAKHLGDPEPFWRICDANRALHPNELTRVAGHRIRITLPEGIPGPPHA